MKTIAIIISILFALGAVAFIGVQVLAYLELFASGIMLKRKLMHFAGLVLILAAATGWLFRPYPPCGTP